MRFVARTVSLRHFDVRMDVSRPLHAIGALGSKSAAPEPTANVLTVSVTGGKQNKKKSAGAREGGRTVSR